MPMDMQEIEQLIREALPDAQIHIDDLRGDGDHYAARVISAAFAGKSRVEQHQMVYRALRGRMGDQLHALALQTGVPRGRLSGSETRGDFNMMEATISAPAENRIRGLVDEHQVVLFMKGTPVFPQCGFSATVVQMLSLLGVRFKGVDVLEDPEIRQGIKSFSDWPTIPQLYVKGEFVGGCDIVREMYETGELAEFLSTKGIGVEPQA